MPTAASAIRAQVLSPARPRLGEALCVALAARSVLLYSDRATCAWVDGEGVGRGPRSIAGALSEAVGYEAPPELWEALASRGVIPQAWPHDPLRSFVCPHRQGAGLTGAAGLPVACPECESSPVLAHPPTLAACLALAADPRGVATAEDLAREGVARLRAIDDAVPAPRAVAWRFVGPRWFASRQSATWRMLYNAADRHCPPTTRAQFGRHELEIKRAQPALHERTRGMLANLRSYAEHWPSDSTAANPFAPLVDLWDLTGYGLGMIDEQAITLVAPYAELAP